MIERDVMEYDVLVVGAGPAGLACAIRLKQLDPARSVCVLEKAAAVGSHALSGAVMEPGPLDALLPGWRDTLPDLRAATRDEFRLAAGTGSLPLPVPPQQRNRQFHPCAQPADAAARRGRGRARRRRTRRVRRRRVFDAAGAVAACGRRHGARCGWIRPGLRAGRRSARARPSSRKAAAVASRSS
jgi:glycine/D-amino acid oxidase-like deaminating enzyme